MIKGLEIKIFVIKDYLEFFFNFQIELHESVMDNGTACTQQQQTCTHVAVIASNIRHERCMLICLRNMTTEDRGIICSKGQM